MVSLQLSFVANLLCGDSNSWWVRIENASSKSQQSHLPEMQSDLSWWSQRPHLQCAKSPYGGLFVSCTVVLFIFDYLMMGDENSPSLSMKYLVEDSSGCELSAYLPCIDL